MVKGESTCNRVYCVQELRTVRDHSVTFRSFETCNNNRNNSADSTSWKRAHFSTDYEKPLSIQLETVCINGISTSNVRGETSLKKIFILIQVVSWLRKFIKFLWLIVPVVSHLCGSHRYDRKRGQWQRHNNNAVKSPRNAVSAGWDLKSFALTVFADSLQLPMSTVKNNVVLTANDGFTKWRQRLGRKSSNTRTLFVNKLCSSYSHYWDKFEEWRLSYSAMWRCTVRRVSTVAEEPTTSCFKVWRERQMDLPNLPDDMVSRATRQQLAIIGEKITNRTRV